MVLRGRVRVSAHCLLSAIKTYLGKRAPTKYLCVPSASAARTVTGDRLPSRGHGFCWGAYLHWPSILRACLGWLMGPVHGWLYARPGGHFVEPRRVLGSVSFELHRPDISSWLLPEGGPVWGGAPFWIYWPGHPGRGVILGGTNSVRRVVVCGVIRARNVMVFGDYTNKRGAFREGKIAEWHVGGDGGGGGRGASSREFLNHLVGGTHAT